MKTPKPPKEPLSLTKIKDWSLTRVPSTYYEAALVPSSVGVTLGVISLKNAVALRDRIEDGTLDQTDAFAHRMRVTAVLSDLSLGLGAGLVAYGYLRSKPKPPEHQPESQPAVTLSISPFGASLTRSF